jgi:LacI family transcriptional regulator
MPTLADVALRAGVSKTTASRVLNNKLTMPIPQQTADRIREAARELQYVPNRLARALATRRSYTLGLYDRDMTGPIGILLLDAIETAARERSYYVLVSARLESVGQAANVDGLIVVGQPPLMPCAPECPVVYIYPSREAQPNTISWSDYAATREAALYLASRGHRHVAAIYGSHGASRRAGFCAGVAEAGLTQVEYLETSETPSFKTREEYDDFYLGSGYRLARQMLREQPETTAVFVRNDLLAAGVLRALHEAGVPVPARMSVLSYNDTSLARGATPPLTSIRSPIEEAGRLAVNRLIEAAEGGDPSFPGIELPTSLIIRASTAAPYESAHAPASSLKEAME